MTTTPASSADDPEALARRKRTEAFRIAVIGGVTSALAIVWMFWVLEIGR